MRYPGPGAYVNNDNKNWNKDLQTTLKSRTSIFYDDDIMKSKHCISPQTYLPPTKIQQNARFTGITFGKGPKVVKIQTSKFFIFYFFFVRFNFYFFYFKIKSSKICSWSWCI